MPFMMALHENFLLTLTSLSDCTPFPTLEAAIFEENRRSTMKMQSLDMVVIIASTGAPKPSSSHLPTQVPFKLVLCK